MTWLLWCMISRILRSSLNVGKSHVRFFARIFFRGALEYLQPVRLKCAAIYLFAHAWESLIIVENIQRLSLVDTSSACRDGRRPLKKNRPYHPLPLAMAVRTPNTRPFAGYCGRFCWETLSGFHLD